MFKNAIFLRSMEKFELNTEYIELCKLLKACGWCRTGGQAKQIIENQMVKLDGTIETRKRCKIRPGQKVEYQNEAILVTVKSDT